MERRLFAAVMTVAALTLIAGCKTTEGTGSNDSGATSDTGSGTGSEFKDGSLGSSSSVSSVTISDLGTVYFDYDRSDIRADAAQILRQNAKTIKENTSWTQVVIQGNTDERGSEEYNLALGERRAGAVKNYLVDLGVEPSRLRTVSFGEARPAVPGHDESVYRYNRRSDFAAR